MRQTDHDLELNLICDVFCVVDDDADGHDFEGLGILTERNVLDSSLTILGKFLCFGKFVNF